MIYLRVGAKEGIESASKPTISPWKAQKGPSSSWRLRAPDKDDVVLTLEFIPYFAQNYGPAPASFGSSSAKWHMTEAARTSWREGDNGEGGVRDLHGEPSDRDGFFALQPLLRRQAGARCSENRGHRLSGRPPAFRAVHFLPSHYASICFSILPFLQTLSMWILYDSIEHILYNTVLEQANSRFASVVLVASSNG